MEWPTGDGARMTVQMLIELLAECEPDTEVRLAYQPNWPLQAAVAGIATTDDLGTQPDDVPPIGEVVWLVAGDEPADSPYAPTRLWDLAHRD
jgi:hypothetical protein